MASNSTLTWLVSPSMVRASTQRSAFKGRRYGNRSMADLLVCGYDRGQYRVPGSFHQKWPRTNYTSALTPVVAEGRKSACRSTNITAPPKPNLDQDKGIYSPQQEN